VEEGVGVEGVGVVVEIIDSLEEPGILD